MSDPFKELVNIFGQQSSEKANFAVMGIGAELGTITARRELKLDNFKHAINDYLIADYLTLDSSYLTRTTTNDSHSHSVLTPDGLRPLSSGDRVLVAAINNGQDYVVIARVKANA